MNQEHVPNRALFRVAGLAAALVISASHPRAEALMAGQLPDTPAARVDPNSDVTYSGVGSVVVNGSPLSGVVIAGEYVLTAAHVVSGQSPSAVQFVLNLPSGQWTSSVVSIAIYPTYSFPYDDLAVLRLGSAIPSGVPIYRLYTGALTTGIGINLVGYGASGNGNAGVTVGANAAIKRVGNNVVDILEPTIDNSGLTSRFYLYDFDGPTGNGPLGGPTTGNSTETLVAEGDSGSPAFVRTGNSVQLFGINNFVASTTSTTVNYQFGTLGGGIVAADPRFAAWLESSTGGTLGQPAGGDAPLPEWATLLLAVVLGGVLFRRARTVSET